MGYIAAFLAAIWNEWTWLSVPPFVLAGGAAFFAKVPRVMRVASKLPPWWRGAWFGACVAAAILYACGAAWITEHKARVAVEVALAEKSRPQPRIAALEGIAPAIRCDPHGCFIVGVETTITNLGADMIEWTIAACELTMAGKLVVNTTHATPSKLPPRRQSTFRCSPPAEIPIPAGSAGGVILVRVRYDTNPTSGARAVSHKIQVAFNWINGDTPLIEPTLLDHRED